jgi:hypothetical protein
VSVAAVKSGHQATTNTGTAAIPVSVPSSGGPATGDWMVAIIHTTATNAETHAVSAPSGAGWVQVLAPSLLSSRILTVFAKRRASDDPASWSFTQAKTGTALVEVLWGTGGLADVTAWLKGAFSKGANLTTQTTPGVSGATAGSLVISIQAEATSATESDVMTVDSPFVKWFWSLVGGSNPVNSLLVATQAMSADGATGDAVSRGWPNSTGNRGSFMLVIPPAPDATPTPVAKLDAKMSDGAGNVIPVKLTAIDESGKEIALAKLELVHSGSFVPDLDRMSRVWWMAHRGGSADYQEHSARGYVQSAIAHADVLEFSVGRTSDGVFFGLHDATLNRTTSGLAANYLASEHTWAEISTLVQDISNRNGTAPYLKLDDFIAQWSPSHSLMFDPKLLSSASRADLLARLQQIPDYRNRVLGKFYTTGTVVADEFHAIGCKAWGYSYTADVENGTTAATAAKWDYLGLEYTASEATWATMLQIAGGKKVLGHICPSAAAAQQAVARGARALQVSGVNSVATVY